jgi:hypothetical protein
MIIAEDRQHVVRQWHQGEDRLGQKPSVGVRLRDLPNAVSLGVEKDSLRATAILQKQRASKPRPDIVCLARGR